MITKFLMREPAVISRCGLLEVWTKLAVAFDETMEPIQEIGGVDRIHVSTFRNDSSHFYIDGFDYPLSLYCQIMSGMEENVKEVGLYAYLYINRKTNEALALHEFAQEEFRGDIDTVVKSLSTVILKRLQDQWCDAN